ncbi:hypothetical protein [Flavobacterium sp. GCM10027622]|uniref:hypothetical protein n=1 Tax=unclassified Flavobacterium TaxID=196869 RepID=UPI003611B433
MKEKEYTIRRSFKDNASRKLVLNENFIKFEDKDRGSDLFTIFHKDNIESYTFGIQWIKVKVIIGRIYQIQIRSKDNKKIKISFRSYLGRNTNQLNQLYTAILSDIWNFYFEGIVINYLQQFQKNETFSIGDVTFTKENLVIRTPGLLKDTINTIPWNKVKTKNFYHYFSVYSADDPSSVNRGFSYKDDENTNVLYSVVRTILKNTNKVNSD